METQAESPEPLRAPAKSHPIHGARSEYRIAPVARAQRRRFLRRNGLVASDLDAIAAGYLDAWSRTQAKIELLDRYIAEQGLLNEKGEIPAFMTTYVSLINSATRILGRLHEHVRGRDDSDRDLASALAALDAEETKGSRRG